MKKKTLKSILFVLLTVILTIMLSLPTFAYSLLGYRHQTSDIYYYYDNWIGMRAKTFYYQGANAWADADVDARFLYDSVNSTGVEVYVTAGEAPDAEWDGLTQTYYNESTGYVVSQSITLNMSQTVTWNSDGALKSVVVHEIGHVFGLGEAATNRVIMNSYTFGTYSRYGYYGLTTPQSDDIAGVNSLY